VNAVKAADVVISTVRSQLITDQTRLVDAITDAGNVKVLVPCFGTPRAFSIELLNLGTDGSSR
jgi:hypothetical protein